MKHSARSVCKLILKTQCRTIATKLLRGGDQHRMSGPSHLFRGSNSTSASQRNRLDLLAAKLVLQKPDVRCLTLNNGLKLCIVPLPTCLSLMHGCPRMPAIHESKRVVAVSGIPLHRALLVPSLHVALKHKSCALHVTRREHVKSSRIFEPQHAGS